jgi:hypothetical protein
VAVYGSSVNFTRYFGTTYSDQPLEISFAFSNEEVAVVPIANQVEAENPMTRELVVADDRLPADIRGAFPVVNGLREATDEDLPDLNYDGLALINLYKPGEVVDLVVKKPPSGEKGLVTIYGSALRIVVRNVGDKALGACRVFVRGSVF